MSEIGLSGFSQPVNALDVDRLIEQFTELGRRSQELRQAMKERNAANEQLLDAQFAELSAVLFPDWQAQPAGRASARRRKRPLKARPQARQIVKDSRPLPTGDGHECASQRQ